MKKTVKNIKKILKDIVVVWAVFFTLLPTVLMGFSSTVYAAGQGTLNTERAGNYVANFAINFYENWSSVNQDKSNKSNIIASGEILGNAAKIWERVKSDNPYYPTDEGSPSIVTTPTPGDIVDNENTKISVIDCSGFVACVIYATTGEAQFKSSFNCGDLYDDLIVNNNREKYIAKGWEIKTNKECIQDNDIQLKPGDILVSKSDQHCDIYMGPHTLRWADDGYVHYNAYDCGAHDNWTTDIDQNKEFASIKHVWKYSDQNYLSMRIRIPNSGEGVSSVTYGVVKTDYDENASVTDLIKPDDSSYKFNNKSWINFVFYEALFEADANNKGRIFTGAGTYMRVNASNESGSGTFTDKKGTPGVKDVANDSPILDISELISEGKVLPGDILYVNKGSKDGAPAEYEYLLYVGGSKVIYATNDDEVVPSGALKYEYLEYYLRRIRKRLREGHEDDENYEMPKYGVTELYRIKSEIADNIPEEAANLIFNGKGYYSKVHYQGIPDARLYEVSFGLFKWLFDIIKKLLELLLNIMIYAVRMQVIGWANLFENLLQHVLLGITGDNSSSSSDGFFGTSATSESGERITVESIFFNQVPILDANFFNFESAGGHSLVVEQEIYGPLLEGQSRTQTVPDTDNVAYRLRKNLATIYIVLRNLSIAIMLFILLAVGIKIALTSIADKKAEYKKFLTSWLFAFVTIIVMHIFMYTIFMVNDVFVDMCKDWNKGAAKQAVSEVIVSAKSDEEISLYDAVRTKAYAFNWKEGLPATVVYVYLVYLLIRFAFIYFKRYLTIYILALTAPFMGVKYAIDKLLGKKTTSLNKWFKDFSFNVLLQTVHAFIYTIFMAVAISVSAKDVAGALVAVMILSFMLKADAIIIKVFGLDKAGSLADVNKPESFRKLFHKFLPIYTLSAGAVNLGRRTFFGNNGIIRRGLDDIFASGAATKKEANEIWEMKKYKLIGTLARVPGGGYILPIRHLRMLREDLSYDTKKRYYNDIKGYVNQRVGRYTRKVGLLKDMAAGTAGTIASAAVAIADPSAGITMFVASRKLINKHKSMSHMQMRTHRYTGTTKKARQRAEAAKEAYNDTLNKHVDNEMWYQTKYNRLLDKYADASSTAEKDALLQQIKQLRKDRRKEKAEEMHRLQEATESLDEAKFNYGNAKHEHYHNNKHYLKTKRTIEKLSGVEGLENLLMSESRASYDAWDKTNKSAKKLDAMEKAAKQELEIRKLAKKFKEEIKNTEVDGKKISDAEAKRLYEESMSAMVREAKKNSVKANRVSSAITSYLTEKTTDKVGTSDIDGILNKIEENSKRKISVGERQKIRQALEDKMISDNKGLGLDEKDTAEIVRKVLGNDRKLSDRGRIDKNNKDSNISKVQDQLFKKMVDLHTSNQVGKIKHKSELVNINKVIKDAKKSGK